MPFRHLGTSVTKRQVRNREVVRLREEEGWKLERIGDRFEITKQRVSHVLHERDSALEVAA